MTTSDSIHGVGLQATMKARKSRPVAWTSTTKKKKDNNNRNSCLRVSSADSSVTLMTTEVKAQNGGVSECDEQCLRRRLKRKRSNISQRDGLGLRWSWKNDGYGVLVALLLVMLGCFDPLCAAAAPGTDHDAALTSATLVGYTSSAAGAEVLTTTEFGK